MLRRSKTNPYGRVLWRGSCLEETIWYEWRCFVRAIDISVWFWGLSPLSMKIIMSTPINGETYRFSSAVGLTVRLSVRLSVHYTFVSELYLFWTPGGIFKYFCTNVKYDESTCSAYVWPRSVQGHSHSSRLKIVWLYFVPALYLWTHCGIFKSLAHMTSSRLNIVWLRPFTKYNNSDVHFNK